MLCALLFMIRMFAPIYEKFACAKHKKRREKVNEYMNTIFYKIIKNHFKKFGTMD